MRRVSIKVAVFVPLLIAGLNTWAIEEVNGVYQIGSPQDLTEFAELVNSGNTSANACLTADIDLSGVENFTPIGAHYTTPYVGIFDGQGHTISNLKIERNELAETGLFYRICGTVQNLGIVNATVKNPGGWRVGVIGGCSAGGTLINCFTAGDIVLENGQIGGLCGLLQNTTIKSCYTTFSKIGDSEDGTTAENCYWGDGVVSMAPTGELCYKMNGDQKEITWYQTLGEDAYPLVDSTHKQVYAAGDLNCNGQVKAGGTLTYSNTKTQEIPDHHFVDGICTECGQADPGFIQVVDGWYEVGKPEQLMYVSDLVNGGKQDINVRLTADIDLSGITYFPPIGRLCWPGGPMLHYGGTFDGQGHIIYNLSIDKEDAGAETGLFGRLDGATVQNLGIVNATFRNSSALRAGVLAGCANNSRITNCFTTGEFVMDECICTFDTKNGDGMFGLFTGTTASNCYTTHSTFGDHEGSTLNNCYWGESALGMAPTGELCYKLNQGNIQTPAWRQSIGDDDYPVPNATHGIVNQITSAGYATMYLPETNVTVPDGVTANKAAISGSLVILSPLGGNIIPAGTPVVLEGSEGYYSFAPVAGTLKAPENELKGTAEPLAATGTQYVLAVKDGQTGFYQAEAGTTIPAGKAYIEYAGAGVKGFAFGGADGIEGIHNSQFIIHNDNAIYDLSGRRVEKGTKGIYIVNGKKVLY